MVGFALRGHFSAQWLGLRMRNAILAAAVATAFICCAAAQDAPVAADPSSSAAPVDPAPTAASPWSVEVDAARARHDEWVACIEAKRFKCEYKAKPDPMEALLNDDTLVDGDIVATPEGLKVFRGQPGTPHRREDFR